MYKPAAKRRWGYYALPVLYRDRLVGKVDATADRKAGVLRVDAIHEDEPFNKTTAAAVRRELKDLARWLELDLILPGLRTSPLSWLQGPSAASNDSARPAPTRFPFRRHTSRASRSASAASALRPASCITSARANKASACRSR